MKIKLIHKLLNSGYFDDEKTANAWIMNRKVFVDGKLATKSGLLVHENSQIVVKDPPLKFTGKGGYKLEKALKIFSINIRDRVVFDAGASSGGFTDCLLHYGAKKVYAVDVGFGQLSGHLRNNHRVSVHEKCNISDFRKSDLDEKIDLCTVDLSYLSILKAVPVLARLFDSRTAMICLIKPLFEGLQQKDKSDFNKAAAVLGKIIDELSKMEYQVHNCTLSPIYGGRGALEFLVFIEKTGRVHDFQQKKVNLLKSLETEFEESPPLSFKEYIKIYQ